MESCDSTSDRGRCEAPSSADKDCPCDKRGGPYLRASPSRMPYGCAPTSQFQRQKYVFIHINGDKTKPMIRMKHNSKMDEAVEVIGCIRSIVHG